MLAEQLENKQGSSPLKPYATVMEEKIITPAHTCHLLEMISPTPLNSLSILYYLRGSYHMHCIGLSSFKLMSFYFYHL